MGASKVIDVERAAAAKSIDAERLAQAFGEEVVYEDDAKTLEGFLAKNPFFLLPYLAVGVGLYHLQQVPLARDYFASRGMEPWGFLNVLHYAAAQVALAFAIHGFIAVYHDKLVEAGLKLQEAKVYHFNQQQAASRYTVIMLSQVCVYWALPIRPDAAGLPGLLQFFAGLAILYVLQDAWFFFVHWLCHQPGWYQQFHKTHHRWKTPTPFAAYYISKYGHLVQEHSLTVPVMLFCPVPLSSWLYFQYVGTFGSLLQHSNFVLTELRPLPFSSVSIGQLMTVFNPWGFLLGFHTTAHHDYHHENFLGNFQLSYTYLDRFFGTYVEPATPGFLREPLVGAEDRAPAYGAGLPEGWAQHYDEPWAAVAGPKEQEPSKLQAERDGQP